MTTIDSRANASILFLMVRKISVSMVPSTFYASLTEIVADGSVSLLVVFHVGDGVDLHGRIEALRATSVVLTSGHENHRYNFGHPVCEHARRFTAEYDVMRYTTTGACKCRYQNREDHQEVDDADVEFLILR